MSKTTVVLDRDLLENARLAIGAKTKKAAIEAGLRELIESRARKSLRKLIGKPVVEMTPEELDRMREDE